jgi:hypothetical protein
VEALQRLRSQSLSAGRRWRALIGARANSLVCAGCVVERCGAHDGQTSCVRSQREPPTIGSSVQRSAYLATFFTPSLRAEAD